MWKGAVRGTVQIENTIGVPPRNITVEARIIRRDGTIEELGTVAYYHRNPLKRWWWHLRNAFKRRGVKHGYGV